MTRTRQNRHTARRCFEGNVSDAHDMTGGANCRQSAKQLTEAGKPNDEAPDTLNYRREGNRRGLWRQGGQCRM